MIVILLFVIDQINELLFLGFNYLIIPSLVEYVLQGKY